MRLNGYIPGLAALLLLSACDEKETWSGGDLRGVNHTSAGINRFTVNDYGGPNVSPYGEGGGYCCIGLPDKWRPGLKANVEWEVDPKPFEHIPLKPGGGYEPDEESWARHKANYRRYSTTVDIPQYGEEHCGLTVHFLPCQQIKATASCWSYGAPEYPIKEPRKMEEPAICPQ